MKKYKEKNGQIEISEYSIRLINKENANSVLTSIDYELSVHQNIIDKLNSEKTELNKELKKLS